MSTEREAPSARFGLSEAAIAKICSVLSRFPGIDQALIYGSRAMGTYRNGSDIDLTLCGPALRLDDLLRIENELDDLLLPHKIDLSLFERIQDPDVVDHIQRVGQVFYQRVCSRLPPGI